MGQKKMVQNGYNPTLWQAEWNKQMTINQRVWEYSPDVSFQIHLVQEAHPMAQLKAATMWLQMPCGCLDPSCV
jgi:hypothetical protein